VAFVADHQRSVLKDYWLNPLFRYAISRGWLSPDWYLTAIDLGDEITHGGTGTKISMQLQGVK
jgi:hypothetical protein